MVYAASSILDSCWVSRYCVPVSLLTSVSVPPPPPPSGLILPPATYNKEQCWCSDIESLIQGLTLCFFTWVVVLFSLPRGTSSSASFPYVIIPWKGFTSPLNWQCTYSCKLSTSEYNMLLTSWIILEVLASLGLFHKLSSCFCILLFMPLVIWLGFMFLDASFLPLGTQDSVM